MESTLSCAFYMARNIDDGVTLYVYGPGTVYTSINLQVGHESGIHLLHILFWDFITMDNRHYIHCMGSQGFTCHFCRWLSQQHWGLPQQEGTLKPHKTYNCIHMCSFVSMCMGALHMQWLRREQAAIPHYCIHIQYMHMPPYSCCNSLCMYSEITQHHKL